MVDPQSVLVAHGGVAREGLLRRTVGRDALLAAVQEGRVVRSAWGTYALPTTTRPRVLATQLRGVLSHRSAARHWGLGLPPDEGRTEDVLIRPQAQRRNVPPDVRLRFVEVPPSDVTGHVTTPARTVIDCLRDLDLAAALSVGDSALRKGLVTRAQLLARARSVRGPKGVRVRSRIAMLDPRAANAFESTCRAILLAAGITGFVPQVSVRSGRRWLGRVDLAHATLDVLIECDGFEHHGERRALRRDCRRHTAFVCAGWIALRFSWEDVMYDPEWVVSRVCEALALAAARA